jgi:hypothetical protein
LFSVFQIFQLLYTVTHIDFPSMQSQVVISLPSVTVQSARIDLISPLFRLAINSYPISRGLRVCTPLFGTRVQRHTMWQSPTLR